MEMTSQTNSLLNQQYVFDDFILCNDGSLIHKGQSIHIPPKELAVLKMLVEANGQLVSKNDLLNNIWADSYVNEESLTRCIYILRRILSEYNQYRYIDSVYGKGYRFSQSVAVVSLQKPEIQRRSIAILPFQTHPQLDASTLHYELIRGLLRYSPFGLEVFPASLTQDCHNLPDIITLIGHLNPDFYMTGRTFSQGDTWKIRLELIQANTHHLIHYENIEICLNQPITSLQNKVASILPNCIPELRWNTKQTNELGSVDIALVYLNARRELQLHTPSSIRKALTMLQQCIVANSEYAQPYCTLAECYLTMSQLGIFDQKQALSQARLAVSKAVEIAPDNSQALGLLALTSAMNSEHSIAKTLFEQAWLLAPDSIDLYYYYGWYFFLSGEFSQAKVYLKGCLERDPSHIAASILNIWLTYYDLRLDDAIGMGKNELSQYGQGNPVLQSVQALLLAIKGEYGQAEQLIESIKGAGEEIGIIAVNLSYIEYCLYGDNALPSLRRFLTNVDSRYVRASLLPLILAAHGHSAALNFLHKLQNDDYHWIKIWVHDPRLSELVQEINKMNPLEAA